MFNKLYFICPTDNIESIINSKLNDNNFYITSLANSITLNYNFIRELYLIIESKKIREITFVLSDDNRLINDILENKDNKNIRSLDHLNLEIYSHKNFFKKELTISEIRLYIISYLLNQKKNELKNITDSLGLKLDINAKVYNKEVNEFTKVKSKLINMEFFNLN
tara:strand:- start:110 stop:604 length:495 start_codon:yes stop_codon:yes gene_type:complete